MVLFQVRYQQLLLTIRDLEEQLKAMEAELVQSMSQVGCGWFVVGKLCMFVKSSDSHGVHPHIACHQHKRGIHASVLR